MHKVLETDRTGSGGCFQCFPLGSGTYMVCLLVVFVSFVSACYLFLFLCYKSGSCEEWPTLVLGCIWGLFVNKNSPEKIQRHITNTDKIQQNAQSFYIAHTLIYSFIHSFIHSFIPITHHTTHASPMHHTLHHTMHHPFITLHLNASYHASPIRHTASQHIIPVKHYIQQITLTHSVLNASQRWCIITIMHHSDDASQQCITTLMHYGTT